MIFLLVLAPSLQVFGEEAAEFPVHSNSGNRAAFISKVLACLGAARSTGLPLA